jgi:hypothetical protein
MLTSRGKRLFLIQDVTNHPAVSLHHPGWHLMFDQDPAQAEKTRRKTLDWLAAERIPVQAFHFPFPGRAKIEKAGNTYRALPIG